MGLVIERRAPRCTATAWQLRVVSAGSGTVVRAVSRVGSALVTCDVHGIVLTPTGCDARTVAHVGDVALELSVRGEAEGESLLAALDDLRRILHKLVDPQVRGRRRTRSGCRSAAPPSVGS